MKKYRLIVIIIISAYMLNDFVSTILFLNLLVSNGSNIIFKRKDMLNRRFNPMKVLYSG